MSTPASFAASRMLVPAGTVTWRPSTVRLTAGAAAGAVMPSVSRDRGGAHRAPPLGDVRLELVAELLDPAHDRRRARVAQHADGLARHVLRELEERVEVLHRPLARLDALHDLRDPRGALAALGTLGAALVGEEARYPGDVPYHALPVV